MKKLLALLFIVPLFAACSEDGTSTTTPQPTATVTVTITATPNPRPTPKFEKIPRWEIKMNNKEKLEWARSDNRKIMFQDYETAKYVVARALENGTFGKPYRYNDMKVTWRPGQVGWGGISFNSSGRHTMNKPSAFAGVWFRADGSIDYSQGISGILIDAGPEVRGVLMYDKMLSAFSVKVAPPYEVALDEAGDNRGRIWSSCIDTTGYCERRVKFGRFTTSGADMANLDDAAITALNRSMTMLFGTDWRQM